MLELKPTCENCNKSLPNDKPGAMICTIECTFCLDCVTNVLHNVCPNCGGGLEKRPIRPKEMLKRYPQSTREYFHPVNLDTFQAVLNKYRNIEPEQR
jgi:hypothetical protein